MPFPAAHGALSSLAPFRSVSPMTAATICSTRPGASASVDASVPNCPFRTRPSAMPRSRWTAASTSRSASAWSWPRARVSARSWARPWTRSLPPAASTRAAAHRCAAMAIRRSARAMARMTIRSAARASPNFRWKAAYASAISASCPLSTQAISRPASCRVSATCGSARAWVCATTLISARSGWMSARR